MGGRGRLRVRGTLSWGILPENAATNSVTRNHRIAGNRLELVLDQGRERQERLGILGALFTACICMKVVLSMLLFSFTRLIIPRPKWALRGVWVSRYVNKSVE